MTSYTAWHEYSDSAARRADVLLFVIPYRFLSNYAIRNLIQFFQLHEIRIF